MGCSRNLNIDSPSLTKCSGTNSADTIDLITVWYLFHQDISLFTHSISDELGLRETFGIALRKTIQPLVCYYEYIIPSRQVYQYK